jgi:cytochrome c-type biogenesis protein CcmF
MRSRGENAPRALYALVSRNRRRYGGYIVHIGVLFVFAGVAGALFVQERSVRLRPGDAAEIGALQFVYRGTDVEQGPNYVATVGNLTVTEDDGSPMRMRPERRFYPTGEEQTTTEVAIWSRMFEDVYAILEAFDPATGRADVTLLVNPMVRWIWLGGAIMVMGTLIALSTPRLGKRRTARDRDGVEKAHATA